VNPSDRADDAAIDDRVVFFPVRHHSPFCARMVVELAERMRPSAVLIEGPSDYNDRIDELYLGHHLPIAIYSYVRLADGSRRGAYYPFCVFSPEWQALQIGRRLGATVRFIDLPWADVAGDDRLSHRYADAEMRGGDYIATLCQRLGVDDFDALWDEMFEVEPAMTVDEYLRRGHAFCEHLRRLDGEPRPVDLRREAFMVGEIRRSMEEHRGRLLVVTGGFHSSALQSLWNGVDTTAGFLSSTPAAEVTERGLALTPYSYERLDGLKGYEAGMPNPGFYHQAWEDGRAGLAQTHRRLLARVAKVLRDRGQPISAADLIAAQATARGLAALRGHAAVWRRDLVDGIAAALVKDESVEGRTHPLLDAVHEVFRGGERGRLAAGTALPPLVHDLKRRLAENGWELDYRPREFELDLDSADDRPKSRVLHQLTLLGIAGFSRLGGTDFARREDLVRCWERWRLTWSPDLEASAIEAARYGSTVAEAAAARLLEAAARIERDARSAARLLLDAVLAGLDSIAGELQDRLAVLIRQDGDFLAVTGALGHLLYLFRHDATLGSRGRTDVASLLVEAFARGLWLLEGLGQVTGHDAELIDGVRALLHTFEQCAAESRLDRVEFLDVLARVGDEASQTPVVRGAAYGALWTLGAADPDRVRTELKLFADPSKLGDFLTGLFGLAREAVQRQIGLILGIDELLAGYSAESFLEALPSLRLAFTYFTPREKHHMALTLLQALGVKPAEASMAALEVSHETAARAMVFESRLFRAMQQFGVRGATG
jgi:hypothetical protein